MKKKSVWLVLSALVLSLSLAFAACGPKEPQKTEYKLSKTAITLTVGQTETLAVTPAPDGTVGWTSSDESVATVKDGTVTAVAQGLVTVTAAIEGADPLTCAVTVKAETQQEEDHYTLDITALSLKTGETKQLSVFGDDGKTVTGAVWSSDDSGIASVSASGLVTAVAAGETNIKAKIGTAELSCKVTVTQKYTYSLDKTSLDLAAGASETITLVTSPEPAGEVRPHTFSSSDTGVATVDGGSGKVTGVAKGTATITCSVDGEELHATVTVTEYTLKVDGAAWGESLAMRVGEGDKQITVTADPASHAVEATYHSENGGIVTVSDTGVLHAVGAGSANVTVTVGGRTFTTTVIVSSEVQYTLKADGEEIENGTLSLKLGETLQLSVERDPAGALPAVKYHSDSEEIAEVNGSGLVTATGIGSAQITVEVGNETTFTVTVNVSFGMDVSEIDYPSDAQKANVNLDALDETNVTLDWRYFGRDNYTERKKDGNLIGDYNGTKGTDFYDYRVLMSWTDGTATAQSLSGRNDGITFKQGVSFTVKVTDSVKYISVFTGAYHATNTISISYNGVVCAEKTFENNGDNDVPNKNKQIIFTPDTEHLVGGEMEFTITITCGAESAHGWTDNISLVAVAVVGNRQREENRPSATAETPVVSPLTDGTVNLSTVGTEDWVYTKNGNDGGVARRADTAGVIKEDLIQYSGGDGTDWLNAAYGRFTWYANDCASAPVGGSVNNTHWANETWSVPIHLGTGKHVVTLYLTGWKCSYFVSVIDGNANVLIDAHQVVTGDANNNYGGNQAVEVRIILDVTAEDDFTFRMTKSGDGNHGWAAIAVGYATEYALEQDTFDVTLHGTGVQQIKVLKNGAACGEQAVYETDAENVATVGQDGTITAAGAGYAIVTVRIGGVALRAFVTVTEYTLAGGNSVILPKNGTYQIRIEANPAKAYTASYRSETDTVADVSEEGLVNAKTEGETKIFVTIGDLTLELSVKVVDYRLSDEQIEVTLGDGTEKTLTMQDGEGHPAAGVKYTSENPDVAEIDDETGKITVKGFGKTTLHAELTEHGVTLDCEIVVKLKVDTDSTKDYADGSDETVNLDELDGTGATLDWRFFRNGDIHEMTGGELIGDLSAERTSTFGDYRTHITWYNGGEQEKASFFGYTDGWTFDKGVSFDVKVTKDVKYIAILTGAWHAKNTVTISYDGVVYATYEFENRGSNDGADKCKQVVFTPDMANFGEGEKTFTVTLTVGGESDNGWSDNVSLVAIAVVGNTPRGEKVAAGSASESHDYTEGGAAADLTAAGTRDWAYICDNQNGLVKKTGVKSVIYPINCIGSQGNGADHFANRSFKWTDGTTTPAGGETTDFFKWCDNVQAICIDIVKDSKVILWISAWKASVDLTVYEGHGIEVLSGVRVIEGDGGNSKGVKVEISLTVTEESVFTFLIRKNGDGNFGLGAVAVATDGGEDPVETYSLSYELSEGETCDGLPGAAEYAEDAEVTVFNGTPQKQGYSFLGWKVKEGGETVYSAGETFRMPAKDVVLIPVWTVSINIDGVISDWTELGSTTLGAHSLTDDRRATWYGVLRDDGVYLAVEYYHNNDPKYGVAQWWENTNFEICFKDGAGANHFFVYLKDAMGVSGMPTLGSDGENDFSASKAAYQYSGSSLKKSVFEVFFPTSLIGKYIENGVIRIGLAVKTAGGGEAITGGSVNYTTGDAWYAPYGLFPGDPAYYAYLTRDGLVLSEHYEHPEWQYGAQTAAEDDKSVTVDGDISEWSKEHTVGVTGSGEYDGKSVTFFGKMTKDGLYLAVEAYHSVFTTGQNDWWLNTNLELRIGRNWGGDGNRLPQQFWVKAVSATEFAASESYITVQGKSEMLETGKYHTVIELFIPAENLVTNDYMVRNGMINVGYAFKTPTDQINNNGANEVDEWWTPKDANINNRPACVDGTGAYKQGEYRN